MWIGIDVAKASLYLCAMDRTGRVVWQRRIINDEGAIREVIGQVRGASSRKVGWALDMTSGATALVITLLLKARQRVVYVPGRLVSRVGGGIAGGAAKTDARDARTIAEIARMRTDLRPVATDTLLVAELRVLLAHRDDLVGEWVAGINRLRQHLAAIFPALEAEFDFSTRSALILLTAYQTPGPLRRQGAVGRVAALLRRHGARGVMPGGVEAMAHRAVAAAARQRAVLPAQQITAELIGRHAARLLILREEIATCATRIEVRFAAHPWSPILTSVPGIGVVLAARYLVETGGDLQARFGTENRLASYAGLSPVPRSSGTTLAKQHRPVRYNRALRQMFYLASTAAIRTTDGPGRAYYEGKRAEGKLHGQALLCLSRQISRLLWALVRDHRVYTPVQ
ncbi:IS110 family transposase [Nocardia takedensis]